MQERLAKERGRGILRLHNNFVEAIYSLSIDAKKLLLSIILHIQPDNKIQITRKEILQETGIDLKNLNPKHRETIIEELMTKIITIRDKDNPNNRWVKMQLLMQTKYKDGILTTSIYPELFPYFKEAQERLFTRLNIQNIKPLTSIYAIRIYELAKQFADTGWKEMDLEELKNILQVGEKYYRIYDFKKYVLDTAKKQINANTDIHIDYELIKKGRSYKKIKFYISQGKGKKTAKKLPSAFQELDIYLNRTYKGKQFRGDNGLTWVITNIRAIDKDTAEITATDLEHTIVKAIRIGELQKLIDIQ